MSIQYAIRDNSNAIAALNDGEGIAKIDIQRLASVMTSLKGNNNKNGYRTTVTNLNKEINYIYNSLVNNSFLNKENATLLNTYNGFLNGLITKVRTASSINNQVMQNYGVDINFVIENRDKFLHNSDKSDSNKLKVDYVCKNNKEFEKIFNDIKDKYKIKNPKKANFFMFGNNKINGWYKTEKKFDSNIDVSGTTLDDLRNFFDKDYIYCTVSYGKKKHGTSFYELNNEFKDTSFRSEELEILKDRYLFRYVPSQNTIDKILKSFEEIIKENGFEFDSDKAKISAFSLEEFDEINIEIPTSVKKISKKTKKQEFDEIIKEGFRNTGTSFLGHFCSIVDANYGGMPTESDVCYIVQDEDKEEFNKYYNIYKYNGDLKLYNRENLGKYIKNGLEYLFNNNSIEKLNANNANIKAYFNDNCGNFLKEYDSKSGFKEFNDVNNYYDFYSASTPYVSLTFCYRNNDGIQKVNINSVEYPFIKSFNCVDEGVKTFTIKLFDRDFNSLINIYDDNGNKIGESTLEQILALSVGINNTKQENDNEETKYSLAAANYGDVVGTKVTEGMQYNLGIIFGYSETNPKLTQGNSTDYLSNRTDGYTQVGNTKYLTDGSENQRTHRWWETSVEQSNSHNRTLSDRVDSSNQTTIRTELIETLITGYQTEFSSAGIYYTIKAIESSQSELSKYKIYQRYTNIKGTPSEVLYTVMNMVNGIFDNKGEGIKLYIDESCRNGKDVVIEDYEKEEESKEEDNVNKIQEPKQVQISLGSKDALSMYQDNLSNGLKEEVSFKNVKKPKLYKSVLSILNDLKAVMPPKVVDSGLMKDVIVTDQDGNSVKAIQKQNAYRRFTYGVQVDEDKKVKVYFYYQQPTKFKRIKKYEWGPANGKHSVITNIDIKTDNEYALLTSMSTITEKGASIKSRDGHETGIITKKADYADYIAQPGDSTPLDQIAYAYSQALYKGSITIMGDPFYCFDKFVQPYTYPIYLDFRLPVSQSWSNSSSTNKIGYSHFMSGFYVVTKITHDINDSGFRTILEVMSYPNITKDVLG